MLSVKILNHKILEDNMELYITKWVSGGTDQEWEVYSKFNESMNWKYKRT